MTSTLATASSSSLLSFNPTITNTPPQSPPFLRLGPRRSRLTITAAHSSNSSILHHLKTLAGAALFATAALTFPASPARADPPPTLTEVLDVTDDSTTVAGTTSPLAKLLETTGEVVESLKSLLQQKLDLGEDEEALNILKRLISAQPEVVDWKFLAARLASEIGDAESARGFYEEVLKTNPLSFEANFENTLLIDRIGEGEAVIEKLEDAFRVSLEDNNEKESRDLRLIMAQIQFLQKNVDEALSIYQQLTEEDPNDFRPYFCRGVIYTLLDKNDEAKEQFAKYRELSPNKFEVDGYLSTPFSRIKVLGTDES